MPISGLSFSYRPTSSFSTYPLFRYVRNARFISAAMETFDETDHLIKREDEYVIKKGPEWKKLSSKDLGIRTSMISRPTRKVLDGLKRKGYEVYLVGGCVRDLILKKVPKDFDIITSAQLVEVRRAFSRCQIVGRRFPICHVHVGDAIVEVSSFSTKGQNLSLDVNVDFENPSNYDDKDYVRWRNCLHRDFTVNGLMFDPYAKLVYDYMGGLEDIRKAKVRTVIAADISFKEDCARILRGVRIAARLGFRFTRDTAHFVKAFAPTILRLDLGRLMMEMNYMLAYGSAEASLRLLWKYGLLEILLPIQAAYFVRDGFRRRDKRSNMLLSLFSNLDKLLAPDRPCHSSLWVGLLVFHMALFDKPRNPMVVAAFCLAVLNGGHISGAIKIARKITAPHDTSFHELAKPHNLDSQTLADEIADLAKSVERSLSKMTDEYFVSRAMAKYPRAPSSDLVFISYASYLQVSRIFACVRKGAEKWFSPKKVSKIDYELLAQGNLEEVRYAFARVVFDSVYPLRLAETSSCDTT